MTILNINRGCNEGLLKQCESLRGYMVFVGKVRDKRAAGMELKRAVSEAVAECIRENILTDFFREHKEEIVEMGIYEFDQEVYDQVLREDGEAIGIRKGELQKLVAQICKKMRKNKTVDEIAEELEEEVVAVASIYKAAERFAPDYDPDEVFKQVASNN